MAKAKAKEYFKNLGFEVIKALKSKFEEKQLHHIVPELYLQQAIDNIKNSISVSLDQLTERIVEVKFWISELSS